MNAMRPPVSDPLARAAQWFSLAQKREPDVADAAALASCGKNGLPSVRMVLARGPLEGGFVFYTNTESVKGIQLAENPHAALCFHWKSLRRQLRMEGAVDIVPDDEADLYFRRRLRMSQIGAWASNQSRPYGDSAILRERFAEARQRFARKPVPRPPWWKGYRLVPLSMEFWHHRAYRLHERVSYQRKSLAAPWREQMLFP